MESKGKKKIQKKVSFVQEKSQFWAGKSHSFWQEKSTHLIRKFWERVLDFTFVDQVHTAEKMILPQFFCCCHFFSVTFFT